MKKYTLYAIGEIVLVVIGILIALQINNWNENRKTNNIAQNYKQRLINDLKKDTTSLTNIFEITESRTKNIQLYLLNQKSKEILMQLEE